MEIIWLLTSKLFDAIPDSMKTDAAKIKPYA